MSTAKRLKRGYRTAFYWMLNASNSVYREFRALPYNEEQNQRLQEALRCLHRARELLDQSFGPEIGRAEMAEIRSEIR